MYTRESTYLPAIADMVAYYGWSQLGIITQYEELFTKVCGSIVDVDIHIIHVELNDINRIF